MRLGLEVPPHPPELLDLVMYELAPRPMFILIGNSVGTLTGKVTLAASAVEAGRNWVQDGHRHHRGATYYT